MNDRYYATHYEGENVPEVAIARGNFSEGYVGQLAIKYGSADEEIVATCGHKHMMRDDARVCARRLRQDCACGGVLYAGTSIPDAVATHAQTKRHQEWRATVYPEPPAPPASSIVLGPVPCTDCAAPLTWDGGRWRANDGSDHSTAHPDAAAARRSEAVGAL